MGRSPFYTSPATLIRSLRRTIKFLHKKVSTISIPPLKPCLAISKPILLNIPPCPTSKQLAFTKLVPIDIPPVDEITLLQPEQAAHAHHPALDVRDYLQHDLDDEPDPELREIKRQENVRTTLRMIDDALKYSR